MKTTMTKAIAGGAIAVLLAPAFALAHEGGAQGKEQTFAERITAKVERLEKQHEKKLERLDKRDEKRIGQATTTAAAILRSAQSVQAAADVILSLHARFSTTTLSAEESAKLTAMQTAAASAKTEASSAIAAASQVSATASSTTNAGLIADARLDLRQARGFLFEARQNLFAFLRLFWR